MELGQANLEVFAATVLELAREDSDLLVVTSDSRGSAKLAPFAKSAAGQIIEVGSQLRESGRFRGVRFEGVRVGLGKLLACLNLPYRLLRFINFA